MSRAKSAKAYPVAGALECPWPRKQNRTLVPGNSGVSCDSSRQLLVMPWARTVTGSPSPSTSTCRTASLVTSSGTFPLSVSGLDLLGPSGRPSRAGLGPDARIRDVDHVSVDPSGRSELGSEPPGPRRDQHGRHQEQHARPDDEDPGPTPRPQREEHESGDDPRQVVRHVEQAEPPASILIR